MAINFYATGCDYIAHASFSVSPDPYPSGIPCPALNISNITGTITIYASEVTFDSGYGFPAYVYVNGTQVDYLQSTSVSFSSSGVTNVQVVATKTSTETTKGSVTIDMGTGISNFSYSYYLNGSYTTSYSSASRKTIAADVGTDITITGFTYSSTSYGTPVEFAEYTSTAHTTLVTSWNYPDDPKIRVKTSARYFVFTASLKQQTYYGRFTLNANGGAFLGTGYTSISWPTGGVMSGTGTSGAYVSTTLPVSTGNYVPTRNGYTFLGWATSSTATSATYLSGETVGFTATSTSSSSPTVVTLYAVWKQTYTLTYATSYSGVTNMPSDVTGITSGTGVVVSSVIPVKQGYTFVGWSRTDGGTATLFGGSNVYVTADVTLWTVFEKDTISYFYWNGSDTADASLIAKGQPVSNITAARWNLLLAKIKELADACGASFSYTTVSSGDGITAARFNAARTGLSNIKTALGASTTLPAAQESGGTIYATLFNGSTSIKGALNALIGVYNNG